MQSNKKLFFFTVPILFSLLTQQLYSIAASVIAGSYLGNGALTAVGNAGTILMLVLMVSGGLELGCEVLFARQIHSEDQSRVRHTAYDILITGISCGAVMSLLLYALSDLLFAWLRIPFAIQADTRTYLLIYLGGVVFSVVHDLSRAILTALGESRLSFILIFCSSVTSIGLGILFVGYFHWGVAGSALAIVCAQLCGMLASLYCLFRRLRRFPKSSVPYRFSPGNMIRILKAAVPTISQQSFTVLGNLLLQSGINTLSDQISGGYTAYTNVITFITMAYVAFGQSASIHTATYAQESSSLVRSGQRFLQRCTWVYSAIICAVILLFNKQICRLFLNAAEVPDGFDMMYQCLLYSLPLLLLNTPKYLCEGMLRGMNHGGAFMLSNIGGLVLRIASTLLLLPYLHWHALLIGSTIDRLWSALYAGIHLQRTTH